MLWQTKELSPPLPQCFSIRKRTHIFTHFESDVVLQKVLQRLHCDKLMCDTDNVVAQMHTQGWHRCFTRETRRLLLSFPMSKKNESSLSQAHCYYHGHILEEEGSSASVELCSGIKWVMLDVMYLWWPMVGSPFPWSDSARHGGCLRELSLSVCEKDYWSQRDKQ